jgi:hypothetical protein
MLLDPKASVNTIIPLTVGGWCVLPVFFPQCQALMNLNLLEDAFAFVLKNTRV